MTDACPRLAYDLLARAKQLVAAGWCQGTAARDAAGRSVLPADPRARSWSLAGALMAAATARGDLAPAAAREAFGEAMRTLAAVVNAGPQSWNDEPARAQPDVLAALVAAIERLGARERGAPQA